jgi:hypothetical protein
MKRGTPVTACHARTGLFTAPGIFSCALLKSRFDFAIFIGAVQLTSARQPVKIPETIGKTFYKKLFLEKDYEKDYDLPFGNFCCCSRVQSGSKGREFSSRVLWISEKSFATYSLSVFGRFGSL